MTVQKSLTAWFLLHLWVSTLPSPAAPLSPLEGNAPGKDDLEGLRETVRKKKGGSDASQREPKATYQKTKLISLIRASGSEVSPRQVLAHLSPADT